jgi:hypothetical protein
LNHPAIVGKALGFVMGNTSLPEGRKKSSTHRVAFLRFLEKYIPMLV